MKKYLFQLGREYKLSIAEIIHVFPNIRFLYIWKDIAIVEWIEKEEILWVMKKLGWTIKVWEEMDWEIVEHFYSAEKKVSYGISSYWENKWDLKKVLMNQKKRFQSEKISSRFVNKDFQNLSSAQILWEKLIEKKSDFSIAKLHGKEMLFQTFWIQDIESYMRRDYSKSRDMQVWMLPPKLSQIMINLSGWKSIYDPFVGLGTVLIESVYMWNEKVYGTDLAQSMVDATNQNLAELQKSQKFQFAVEKLNAKFIHESEFLAVSDAIVTEGYLWEVMTQSNTSLERIEKQKSSLEKIYEWFFAGLSKVNYRWTIVISFPFWEINTKYVYAENLYDIAEKYCNIQLIIPEGMIPSQFQFIANNTKFWSLLYKRPKQLVGREICKLTIK